MVASTTRAMVERTVESGQAWFWSRTRDEAWHKGATSGNVMHVREVRRNCEDDSLLYLVDRAGPACHTGEVSCYYRTFDGAPVTDAHPWASDGDRPGSLAWLASIVEDRRRHAPEGSYVAGLLAKGVDRIAKKVGEEAAEVIIAAKNQSREELAYEVADLFFHAVVLLADAGMTPADIEAELARRHRN
jgi:phosphoribosyl-ATP pyrophosphohydrolase/phosphoribosyl-AMP cyclohydrolase